jgi:hypothetical protein
MIKIIIHGISALEAIEEALKNHARRTNLRAGVQPLCSGSRDCGRHLKMNFDRLDQRG